MSTRKVKKMRELFKYLPVLMEILPHVTHMTDKDCPMEEKAEHVMQILAILADQTDTELDDLIIDRVAELVKSDQFWDTIGRILSAFRDDPKEFGAVLQEERNLDPATIALIIEVVGLVIRLWRDRRDR